MSERFYTNWPLALGRVTLTGPEAHHLAVVCRLRPGDAVCLFNGDGRDYRSRIIVAGKKAVEIEVEDAVSVERELPFALEVAAPLPKGDRAQFLIEKLTELGVTGFFPLSTQRSVVEPREAKLEKLERYVIEASKQCGRNVLLRIHPLTAWDEFCVREDSGSRLLAHPAATETLTPLPQLAAPRVVVAVGPEGGFTEDEVERAVGVGWQRVRLGPRILRIETAALALATLVAAAQGWERC